MALSINPLAEKAEHENELNLYAYILFFGFFALLIGLVFFVSNYFYTWTESPTMQTTATVIDHSVGFEHNSDTYKSYITLAFDDHRGRSHIFRYEIEDRPHSLMPLQWDSIEAEMQTELTLHYPIGKTITLYYAKDAPDYFSLTPKTFVVPGKQKTFGGK
jgi:hypothetical protein